MAAVKPLLTSAAIFVLAISGNARTKIREAPVDSTLGAKLASRIPCDGDTNPEDQVSLKTAFSPDGWERAFRIEVFDDKFCRHGDLGWACIRKGESTWRQEWTAASAIPLGFGNFGLRSCYAQGSKDAPQIILTGWYRQKADDPKADKQEIWKQVALTKVPGTRWETYQFTDPNGGTAHIEIDRR